MHVHTDVTQNDSNIDRWLPNAHFEDDLIDLLFDHSDMGDRERGGAKCEFLEFDGTDEHRFVLHHNGLHRFYDLLTDGRFIEFPDLLDQVIDGRDLLALPKIYPVRHSSHQNVQFPIAILETQNLSGSVLLSPAMG